MKQIVQTEDLKHFCLKWDLSVGLQNATNQLFEVADYNGDCVARCRQDSRSSRELSSASVSLTTQYD